MFQLFINYRKTYVIDINPIESIYSLKHKIFEKINIPIKYQILTYSSKILRDNISIKEYSIPNNATIFLSIKSIGGFDVFTLLFWIIYIFIFIAYLFTLLLGFLPLIANVYGYMIKWTINLIGNFFNVKNKNWYELITWIIGYTIQIGIIFYFVYSSMTFLIMPILYQIRGAGCSMLISSNRFGFILAMVFIVIYGFLNIPNELLRLTQSIADVSIYGAIMFEPITRILTQIANVGKFAPLYVIPIVGTPFLDGYHAGITIVANVIVNSVNALAQFQCTEEGMKNIGNLILDFNKNPYKPEYTGLRNVVDRGGLKHAFQLAPIALIPSIKENFKCHVDNLPIWKKISPFGIAPYYYSSVMTANGICFALRLLKAFAGIINNIGSAVEMANMVKCGNVAGFFTIIALIIVLLLTLVGII